jgi:hypothetical protein
VSHPTGPIPAARFVTAAARRPTIVMVPCNTISAALYVKRLDDPDARAALAPTPEDAAAPARHRGRVLEACLCYENGSQGFDEAAMDLILTAQPGELNALYQNACAVNGHKWLDVPHDRQAD